MSVTDKLNAIKTAKTNIKQAIINKGVTFDGTEIFDDYADKIREIGPDIPAATLTVTQDGTYNVTNYTSAIVNNSSAVGIPMRVVDGIYGKRGGTFTLPSNATDIDSDILRGAFSSCTSLTSVNLSSLTSVSGTYAMYSAFRSCTSLTSVDLSSLTTVSGTYAMYSVFAFCNKLTSVDLSSLTTIGGNSAMSNAFSNTGLTSVDLSSLTTISGDEGLENAFSSCTSLTSVDLSGLLSSGQRSLQSTFSSCTSLTSVDLSNLTTIDGLQSMYGTFTSCPLTHISFPSLTTIAGFNAMLQAFQSCGALHTVEFPSLQRIGSNNYSKYDSRQFVQAFKDCAKLTSITFPKLEEIYCTSSNTTEGTFYQNDKIQKMYFPKLNKITYSSGASAAQQTACKYIFNGCSSLTELHFASANQAAIEANPGYSTAWGRGAGNVTIYFDL